MKYISTGIITSNLHSKQIKVSRCGTAFELTGISGDLWLRGKAGFAESKTSQEHHALDLLAEMGLVIPAEEGSTGEYFALTNAVILSTGIREQSKEITPEERTVLRWVRCAGLHLTAAELVCLAEHDITPKPELLGEDNRQALVECIYTRETIFDNLLEFAMSKASCRDITVETLLQLLKKGYIYLV